MHRTRNAAYGQPYRGFESLPLRQSIKSMTWQSYFSGFRGYFQGAHSCHLRWSGLRAAQRAMGRRILDLLNDRAMSVSWNLPISVKLPESLREIIIWASGNIEQVEKELRNADRRFLEANRTFLIVFDALAWGETPVPETALLSALSNIGVVEFRMEWRINMRNSIRVAASIKRRGWREAAQNNSPCLPSVRLCFCVG